MSLIENNFEEFKRLINGWKMRELKDQLCTLLVTFQDDKEPNKEITTAHTFASTKQEDYPQHRRIVHSRHTDRDESGRPLSVTERLSQSSLSASIGPLGSDMVEHRRALSSPPFSVTVSPNSLNIEKPTSVPQINTQRQHNSLSLPRSDSPLLTIHEVSLAYTSPKSTSSALQEPTFPNNTLPGLLVAKNKQTAPATITTFPTSGSVHILLPPKEDKKINGKQTTKTMTKLPYVVKRPEGDWAYNRSNGQLQISDRPQKPPEMERHTTTVPLRGEGGSTGDAELSIIPVRVLQQQKTKNGSGTAAGSIDKKGKNGEMEQQKASRKGSPSMTSRPAVPPAPPPPLSTKMNAPISNISGSGLPMLTHHQSRSYESSEQSSMREQRAKGKAKTVFQKTTCELLTEKSVTTFGKPRIVRQQQVPEQQVSQQHVHPTQQHVPTSPPYVPPSPQHVPSSPQHVPSTQQPRGLPRYKHDADREMEAHLYTRYDNGNGRISEERRPIPHQRGGISPETQKPEDKQEKEILMHEQSRLVEQFRRSTTKNGTTDISKPLLIESEPPKKRILSSPEENGHKPVVVLPTKARPDVQKPRLIDYATYKREVQELQRRAAKVDSKGGYEEDTPLPPPMSPAIVLPKKQPSLDKTTLAGQYLQKAKDAEPDMETTIRYFAREELWEKRGGLPSTEPIPISRREGSSSEEEMKRLEEARLKREAEEAKSRRERAAIEEKRRIELEQQRRRRLAEEEAAQAARRRKALEIEEEKRKILLEKQEKAVEAARRPPGPPITSSHSTSIYESFERYSSRTTSLATPTVPLESKMPAVKEQIQKIQAVPLTITEWAVPIKMAEEKKTEELTHKGREIVKKEEPIKDLAKIPAADYEEIDTSTDAGKRLFEQLKRELEYEEEIDTEVRRMRRAKGEDKKEGDEEEEELGSMGQALEHSPPILPSSTEGEIDSEPVEEAPSVIEEANGQWREHWGEISNGIGGGVLSPRHAVKVSMSGELPPLMEEEEEMQPSTLDARLEALQASREIPVRRPPVSVPPPKPPHSIPSIGDRRRADSSFSSAFSIFPASPAHTMEYSPASSDYRSAISARQHFPRLMRPISPAPSGGHSRVLKMVSETSSISSRPLSPYPGSTAASAIRDTREREKKEMSDLNDRLAIYIEKVRFLEAQNRKLAVDLDFLRKRWGRDASNVRDMFEADLRQARKLINETEKQREELERKARAMAEEMAQLKRKNDDASHAHEEDKERMDELLLKLAALESELAALRRRIAIVEEDVKVLKRENSRLTGELQRTKTELDQETLNRIDHQNQVQTLLEELDFLRRAHDQEIQDLQAMAARDTTQENREFFRNELASAMREIREDYERINSRNRTDIESWYKLKVQEIQTQSARQSMEHNYAKEEIKRLRTQLGDLRGKLADLEGKNSLLEKQAEELAYQLDDDQRTYDSALNDRDTQTRRMRDECQALMVELQMLLDTKQTLDAEIAIYRRMLEGEEDRAGLKQLVEQVVRTHQIKQSDESESTRVLRGEKSSRQSYQRSAKGNVSILETSSEGKYIVLENTHRSKEEPIGEWKIRRRIDGRREIIYIFPRDFVLRPGKTVKIWANGHGIHSPPDQLVFEGEDNFGVGYNVQTILYNRENEERASLIQRSSGRQ